MLTVRPELRVAIALVGFLAALCASVIAVVAFGQYTAPGLLLGLACVLAGFGALGISATPAAPMRPLRFTLGIGVVLTLVMVASLPLPPHGSDTGSLVILASAVVLAVWSLFTVNRWARGAAVMIAVLAAYGLVVLIGFAMTVRPALPKPLGGPAQTLAGTLATTMSCAWVAAAWYGRRVWKAPRVSIAQPNER